MAIGFKLPGDVWHIQRRAYWGLGTGDYSVIDFTAHTYRDLVFGMYLVGKKSHFRSTDPFLIAVERWVSKSHRTFDQIAYAGMVPFSGVAKKLADRVGHRWHLYLCRESGFEKTVGGNPQVLLRGIKGSVDGQFICNVLDAKADEVKSAGGGNYDMAKDGILDTVKTIASSMRL